MGEFAPIAPSVDDDGSTQSIPTQVLARWAAIASAQACLSSIPQQVRA